MCNCELNKDLEQAIENNKQLLNKLAEEFEETKASMEKEISIAYNKYQSIKAFSEYMNRSVETLVENVEMHQQAKSIGKTLGIL